MSLCSFSSETEASSFGKTSSSPESSISGKACSKLYTAVTPSLAVQADYVTPSQIGTATPSQAVSVTQSTTTPARPVTPAKAVYASVTPKHTLPASFRGQSPSTPPLPYSEMGYDFPLYEDIDSMRDQISSSNNDTSPGLPNEDNFDTKM